MDIRDQPYLSGDDVAKLNFIRDSGQYSFRKYYRAGLRSHIFEVLHKEDVAKETRGEIVDGIRMFPRARPRKILRILRNRFESKRKIFHEIKKYRMLLECLGPEFIACSDEFIVEYTGTGKSQIILCGLQEYVEGEMLDPWRFVNGPASQDIFISTVKGQAPQFKKKLYKNIEAFVKKIRGMITDKGYLPDLAGVGNLVVTPGGGLKLVDINNIVEIKPDDIIRIDDRRYPSCDVSVEVLSILERDILKRDLSKNDALYRHFLSPKRREKVQALEKEFYKHL